MKINLTISNSLTPKAKKNGGLIPSSVTGINYLELFFVKDINHEIIYNATVRIPFLDEYLNDQDVLLVKKIDKNKFSFEKIEGFSFGNKSVIIMPSELYGYLHDDNLHFTPSLFTAPIMSEKYDHLSNKLSMISICYEF